MKIAMSALVVAALAGAANASIVFETENNNTMGAANFLGTFGSPGEGILVDGAITPGTPQGQTGAPGTPGDVDWFSFTVTGPTTFVASIFAIINNGTSTPDSQLILTDASGTILSSDDDSNTGFMSSLDTITLAAGTYFIGVTGYNDLNIAGGAGGATVLPDGYTGTTQLSGHTENWTYKLIIGLNIVPTPGAAALLGLGGLVAGRRRR